MKTEQTREMPQEPLNQLVQPLRKQVEAALQDYFERLDGDKPNDLYRFVLQEVEPPLLQIVLDYTRGHQSRAAAILGIDRGTLRKKLKQYHLL